MIFASMLHAILGTQIAVLAILAVIAIMLLALLGRQDR